MLNAVFYILKTECQWRFLPKGFPNWKTVYYVLIEDYQRKVYGIKFLNILMKGKEIEISFIIIDS